MRRQTGKQIAAWVVTALLLSSPAYATDFPASTNYRFDETSIGVSSLLESSSANFRGQTGAGDAAAGGSSSTNFQTEAGSDTTADPNLSVTVDTSSAAFGDFSPAAAATATAQFSVINYTSYGYTVQLIGDPPTYGSHQIAAMSANAASQVGIEQFGLNLVANTSPISFGQNPDNGTSPNDFGFGTVAGNYSTPNQFRYVSGETIASAPKSSGKTIYTMSYVVNVTSLTPGGVYSTDQTLVVTGTY
ncbi:MAG TPA: hypothetical protein PK096_00190 [Candidatus Saccharibacteria bacterium]|nr:hypothetical protein [Candidatus Saccharibacteria bacterium]HRK93774.1 hypothetical protein [Candidatus Saccharibacteria bacterium]